MVCKPKISYRANVQFWRRTSFTFLVFCFLFTAVGQTDVDYKLYDLVIRENIDSNLEYFNKTTELVVVVNNWRPNTNEISSVYDLIYNSRKQVTDHYLYYDSSLISLFAKKEIQNAVQKLSEQFYRTPKIDADLFEVEPNVMTIRDGRFKKFHKGIFGQKNNGWDRFYKKYSGANGVFRFSSVVYANEYAFFYAERLSGGLNGTGDLIIVKYINGKWEIMNYYNLWMS